MMTPMECQNMREEIFCISCVYIAVHVRLVCVFVTISNFSFFVTTHNAFVFVDSNSSILVGIQN
jgi:hypothetical protein